MADKEQAQYRVCLWLGKAYDRYKNMHAAGKDMDGLPAINKAVDSMNENKYITVGQLTYLFNRTHPLGVYPNYNTKWGYNKRYGEMMPCDLNDIIDSELVNWSTGTPGTASRAPKRHWPTPTSRPPTRCAPATTCLPGARKLSRARP